jgi:hypothetical protein
MHDLGMLEDLMQSDVLADLHTVRAVQEEAGCREVVLIADWARLNDADHFDRDTSIDGSEKLVRLGGEGTPMVAEFAAAAVGLRLHVSDYTASMRMAEALDLQFRLPLTWQAVKGLRARAGYARLLSRKTRDLPPEHALFVDAKVHEYVDGRVGWSKFEQLIDLAIRRYDPEAARAREEAERKKQFVKKCQPHDGMAGFFMYADAAVTTAVYVRVRFLADALKDLGDDRPLDDRMVTAMLLLSMPTEAVKVLERAYWARVRAAAGGLAGSPAPDQPDEPPVDEAKLLPVVLMFVHMYLRPTSGEPGDVVRVEDHGPVTRDWVRDVLGERARFRVQPVIDLEGQAPVESYEIPDRHRQAVHLMTPADIYPFASGTSRKVQIDHTEEWCEVCSKAAAAGVESACGCGGYSGIGNYGPLSTHHHRIKTFRKDELDVKQPYPGVYLWRDADGEIYLRDCRGTRFIELHRAPQVVWAA